MNDWNSWLSSSETRVALNQIKEAIEELRDIITDGSHLVEKDTDKISLDYTYSIGKLAGMRNILEMLEEMKDDD